MMESVFLQQIRDILQEEVDAAAANHRSSDNPENYRYEQGFCPLPDPRSIP
jgi:hypothetical protein